MQGLELRAFAEVGCSIVAIATPRLLKDVKAHRRKSVTVVSGPIHDMLPATVQGLVVFFRTH